jgi:EAL domain-containing protein (putative c-di-GMP-specific phosphodiesterase class I)
VIRVESGLGRAAKVGGLELNVHSGTVPSLKTGATAVADKERERLLALQSYDILDTPAEEVFDEFARLAASIVGTPIGLVSFVDGNRQWFKAKVGFEISEIPRDVAFCAHAIGSADVLVIPDAIKDDRFSANPLVTGGPKIRFYAGAPLVTATGDALGTLCVIDYLPRHITPEQQAALQILSRHVMAQLELRRRLNDFTRGDAPRKKAVAALRRAVQAGQFMLHYQPKVDMRTSRIMGLEALIRWNCPGKGIISPVRFIPLLEESGLIVEVGGWVVQQAMSDYRDWEAKGLNVPTIAVNVSPHQLRNPEFIRQLEHALGADRSMRCPLDIEITEGVLLEKTEEVIGKLHKIRCMGVGVAIDDFGTGYSSLRYLAHLPIDTLKIDRSFIIAMTDEADDMAIVSSIIALAHGLDLNVVAEGVETDEQRKLLRLLRCDQMQGYLFSPPVPKDKLEELLRAESNTITQRSLQLEDPARADFAERRLSRRKSLPRG